MKHIIIVAITLLALTSCTDNVRARRWGGSETIKLEPQEKFINITWKETSLWIISQDTITGIYYAREKSSLGILEGKVIITK